MTNKEKAQATYEVIQAMKQSKILLDAEATKQAKNKDKEITEYRIGKVNHLKRRKR